MVMSFDLWIVHKFAVLFNRMVSGQAISLPQDSPSTGVIVCDCLSLVRAVMRVCQVCFPWF